MSLDRDCSDKTEGHIATDGVMEPIVAGIVDALVCGGSSVSKPIRQSNGAAERQRNNSQVQCR